jgi:hypothetical protein
MSDLEGNLDVFEPISVLQMLNLARASGELSLITRSNSAQVFFDNGNVTFAGLASRPIKLGEYLVKEGLISEETLEEALPKKGIRKRLGSFLIENGIIEEVHLKQAIEEQIKEVIYEVVRWRKGKFKFRSGLRPKAQDIFIDIPLDHLMLEALKRMDEEKEHHK